MHNALVVGVSSRVCAGCGLCGRVQHHHGVVGASSFDLTCWFAAAARQHSSAATNHWQVLTSSEACVCWKIFLWGRGILKSLEGCVCAVGWQAGIGCIHPGVHACMVSASDPGACLQFAKLLSPLLVDITCFEVCFECVVGSTKGAAPVTWVTLSSLGRVGTCGGSSSSKPLGGALAVPRARPARRFVAWWHRCCGSLILRECLPTPSACMGGGVLSLRNGWAVSHPCHVCSMACLPAVGACG